MEGFQSFPETSRAHDALFPRLRAYIHHTHYVLPIMLRLDTHGPADVCNFALELL